MILPVRRSTVEILFILTLIVTYPINISLAAGIRPVDIVLLVYAMWGAFNRRLYFAGLSALVNMFGIALLLSSLYGILFIGVVRPEHFAFLYKYSILFLCVWLVVSSMLDEKQVMFLLKALLVSFVAVVAYEYYSLWDIAVHHPTLALTFRPNFPFTPPFEGGGYHGDAHLLAAYLSSGLVALMLFGYTRLMRMSVAAYYPLLGLVYVAMVLTGSRNGIVTSGFAFALFAFSSIARRPHGAAGIARVSRNSMRACIGILAIGLAVLVICVVCLNKGHLLQAVMERAFSFDFAYDDSTLGRIRKLGIATALVLDGPILIGIGMQSSHMMFFDSGIGAVLVSSGIIGIVVYASIIALFFANLRRVARRHERELEYSVVFFVSLNYISVNLITEFFLVSRSVVPFCIFLGLMTKWIHTNKIRYMQ